MELVEELSFIVYRYSLLIMWDHRWILKSKARLLRRYPGWRVMANTQSNITLFSLTQLSSYISSSWFEIVNRFTSKTAFNEPYTRKIKKEAPRQTNVRMLNRSVCLPFFLMWREVCIAKKINIKNRVTKRVKSMYLNVRSSDWELPDTAEDFIIIIISLISNFRIKYRLILKNFHIYIVNPLHFPFNYHP